MNLNNPLHFHVVKKAQTQEDLLTLKHTLNKKYNCYFFGSLSLQIMININATNFQLITLSSDLLLTGNVDVMIL